MAIIGNLSIRMTVGTDRFVKQLDGAAARVTRFAREVGGLGKSLLALGGVAATAFAFKKVEEVAVDTEKTMAALAKATDLGGAELAALKGQLQSLSVELKGVDLDHLYEIAIAGAKLGVAREDLVKYADGIARLSTAMDDVPAEEIADSIGKINTVFRMGVEGALKVGSAIDKLADSGVSSAKDILNVTQRISGTAAASRVGAHEAVALAAALLDTGTGAELGATAIQRLLMALNKVEGRAGFARALGVSAEQFAAKVKASPIKALQEWLSAVRKLDGESQLKAIEAIGVDSVQATGEIQKLARQTDVLARYIGLAGSEFATLDQISKSYAITAGTTAAGMTQAGNSVKILADALGSTLLPAINLGLGALVSLATSAKSAFDSAVGGTILPGLAAVAERLAAFPAAVDAAFGPAVSATVAAFGGDYLAALVDEVEAIGWAFRNLPDLVDVAVLMATEKIINLGEWIAVIPENLGRIASYIAGNWKDLIVDGVNAVVAVFRNLGQNLFDLGKAIVGFLRDPTQGFQFNWTPLLDGFKATAAQLPELMRPHLTDLQSEIDAKLGAIDSKERDRLTARAAAGKAAAAAVAPAPAAKAPDASGKFDDAKQYRENAALELGSKEARSAILKFQGRDGGDMGIRDVAVINRQQLAQQQQLNAMVKQLVDAGRGDGLKVPGFT